MLYLPWPRNRARTNAAALPGGRSAVHRDRPGVRVTEGPERPEETLWRTDSREGERERGREGDSDSLGEGEREGGGRQRRSAGRHREGRRGERAAVQAPPQSIEHRREGDGPRGGQVHRAAATAAAAAASALVQHLIRRRRRPAGSMDRHDPVLAVTLLLPIIADQTHTIRHPVLPSRPGRSRTVF